MPPDLEKYRSMIAAFDLTREQQDALIHSLWNLAGSFADRAFGLDPVQLALPPSDWLDCEPDARGIDFEDMPLTAEFDLRAAPPDEEGDSN